ncbi:3-phosphoshikimate 1-carboxyvinyltransferase [Flavobacterium sp.]|uniref:3-phosphoshikimate 1-carboxyvinyltransferase n=1 Tax=Flavobacterium sp. TaxID=239 RepID=UPI00261BAF14|nr:3-phosphoshikimate 1-carboxyvinyltransferase [Flavobacterium sp.]
MDVFLPKTDLVKPAHITISGSKSESNRLLLLQALFPYIIVDNVSDSDDSAVMQKALQSDSPVVDVHHAGTAMRFLTAYFAIHEGSEVILTGSQRMKERPVGVLVTALRTLGADISCEENEGYPPLRIKGKKLSGGEVEIDANISSQYITALMLIGARLEKGLTIVLKGEITSRPYIDMTLNLLVKVGIKAGIEGNIIRINPQSEILHLKSPITIESDWSSASYYYSIIALSKPGAEITLSSFTEDSNQGDSALAEIYKQFGVITTFSGDAITLKKDSCQLSTVNFQLNNTPDIAQTIAVTCFGFGTGCSLTGLHTLKIKETDRLTALKTELEKFGADIQVTNNSLMLNPFKWDEKRETPVTIETYNDHRMAMAFAPLALKTGLIIKDAGVVSKSYPAFWDDIAKLGFTCKKA